MDTTIKLSTAILIKNAKKEVMFNNCEWYYIDTTTEKGYRIGGRFTLDIGYPKPEQDLLKKLIREKRGVHIMINRNASGFFWEMMNDGGTDLGYSDHTGPNDSGVWDRYEEALEDALQVQLTLDLPKNSSKSIGGHWGLYAKHAIEKRLEEKGRTSISVREW